MTAGDVLDSVDVLVVGGGINGAGIARDAAGRGLRVMLVEQDDLAAHTSSASTKLIHGGLRYLEFFEFGLVRKSLREREVLLGIAPHLIYPLRFVMPHESTLRPAWMIRAGLFLYDHLAPRRQLSASRGIDLRVHPAGDPLQSGYRRGFEYSDGWVDDARLVVLNALDAHERGAKILTRTRCISVRQKTRPPAFGERPRPSWEAVLETADGHSKTVMARVVVNATGPWAATFHQSAISGPSTHGLRLVRGSHIIVRRLFDHPYAYLLQASDRRIVFAIPYEENFTLIGTTDIEHTADPRDAALASAEASYLCEQANRYFRRSIGPADIVWSYSGVRPLLEDESSDARTVSRDYALEWLEEPAPWLSVFGGKLTTYRTLAEEAVDRIARYLKPRGSRWTGTTPLPGGEFPTSFDGYVDTLVEQHPSLSRRWLTRLARAYGTRASIILDASATDGYREVAPTILETELRYLVEHEWAQTDEDVLWRRSKLGLHLERDAIERVAEWLGRTPRP